MEQHCEVFKEYGYECTPFSLKGTKCWARLVACHDGDSPTFVFPFAGSMYKFKVRVFGIDTYEITSKNEDIKKHAIKGRNRLIELMTNTKVPQNVVSDKHVIHYLAQDIYVVWIECFDMDKYGRILCKIYKCPDPNERHIGDILIEEKLAYPYTGKTKCSEDEIHHTLY